jgi:regulator of nucleoside diphosphate kinase
MSAIVCAHCGQLNPAFDLSCSGCGAAASADRLRAQLITTRDFALLVHYARSLSAGDALRGEIEKKLSRCAIARAREIPPDVVTLNSRAVFRVEGRGQETRILVDPGTHMTPGLTLPVTTPLGICLLGATAGDRAAALRRDGGREMVEIVRVAYRPEATHRESVDSEGFGPADWPAPVKFRLPMRGGDGGPDDPGPAAA